MPYSENHFRELKKDVQKISGVDFKLKDFRPTFATMNVEKDPNLLVDVSAQLGHSNLMTTQRYYAQISAGSAGSKLEKVWSGNKNTAISQTKLDHGEALNLILQLLGIAPEELAARLLTKARDSQNLVIESKERLTSYN